MTEKAKTLRARFIAAQAEMKNAALNRTNPHFKSSYADLGSVRDATLEALNKHGLGITHSLRVAGDYLIVRTEIIDEGDKDAETMPSEFPVALDKPQQMGSGISYGKRYNWGALCAIASEEDDDGNEAQKTSALRTTKTRPEPKPKAESRDSYSELEASLYSCQTRQEAQAWGVSNRTAIELLPDDWQRTLRSNYSRFIESLVS